MKHRRSDAHQSGGREQRRERRRAGEHEQPDHGEGHADDQRIGRRAAVGVVADERLQQRRRHLLRQGHQPDLGEGQGKRGFEQRINGRNQRLDGVVEQVRSGDGAEHRERGRSVLVGHASNCTTPTDVIRE